MESDFLTQVEMLELNLANEKIKNNNLMRKVLVLENKLVNFELNQKMNNLNNELNKDKTHLNDINAKIREDHGIDTDQFSYNPDTGEIITETKQDGE